MIRSRIGWAALCVTALLLTQCTRPRTELVVTVWSELAWGAGRDLQSLVVTVRRGNADGVIRWQQTKVLGGDVGQWQLPLSFGLYPADVTDSTPVWIEVLGCSARDGCVAGGAIVVQRAIVSYRPEQTVGLDLWLTARCRGVLCSASETCVRETGQCAAARSRDDDVRPLPGGAVPEGMDAATADDSVVDDVSSADVRTDAPFDFAPTDASAIRDTAVDTLGADVGGDMAGSSDVVMAPTDAGPTDVVTTPIDVGPAPCMGPAMTCPCSATNAMGHCRPGESCTGGACVTGTLASSLVITEIMNDPGAVGDDVGEWFEVYNPGATPLDLRNLRISNSRAQSATVTATTPVVIAPMAYAVLARSANMAMNGGVPALYAYGTGLAASLVALSNSSVDAVIIDLGSSATEIDRVQYDASVGTMWPHAMGHSKSLRSPSLTASARAMGASWCDSPTRWAPLATPPSDFGTPGAANNCP